MLLLTQFTMHAILLVGSLWHFVGKKERSNERAFLLPDGDESQTESEFNKKAPTPISRGPHKPECRQASRDMSAGYEVS